jgi:LuxR family maltose regulon positive regulatory protein
LSLISAPAGFGKTTLVSEWIAGCTRPVAWLSLDEADRDPARFLVYCIAALQTIAPNVGAGTLALINSQEPSPIESLLTNLVNDIATIPGNFILVLDDYHAVDAKAIDDALAFLLEHQPPQMHLVIVTREDPHLPLARLRVREQLTELRATELRFTIAQAAEFLNQVMGLDLSADNVAALETRTEGWIAGLQLAALSMQGHTDTASFIKSFTGSHHFVLDYLIQEVLQRQPASIQNFLLRTSILDRMCGPLCDAILLDPLGSGQTTLEYLEHANLFIVPLDNERRWYRYHHLFGDLLRKRLGTSLASEKISELHIRASEWDENNDLMLDAFRHAAEANAVERAVRLMESKQMPIHLPGAATTVLNWLESLPTTILNAQPTLWWKQAWLLLSMSQIIGVEEKLKAAEAALANATPPNTEVDDQTRDLIGKIAVTRANLAQLQVQTETTLIQARRALEYLHPNSLSHRSLATRLIGYVYYWQDNWDAAERSYTDALSLAEAAGDIPNTLLALIGLGQVHENKGQFHLAAETHQHVLRLIGDYSHPNAVASYLGLTLIFYQWNDLDTAEEYAVQGLKLAQQYDQIVDRIVMSELYLSLIKLARGDAIGAAQLVSHAEQICRQKNWTWRLSYIAYHQALIHLRQGNLAAIAQLTRDNDLPLVQARVLIRQNDPSAALQVLKPLRQEAEAKRWTRRLLDVMAVQSIALYAHGEREQAVELLGQVMAIAEPNGLIRLFVDEGEPMQSMIDDLRTWILKIAPHLSAYLEKLGAAFPSRTSENPTSKTQNLVEPLSERELQVLRLIAQGLSNQEICDRLFLALSTVKGHSRIIFDKLEVHNRTQAVARARELGLL